MEFPILKASSRITARLNYLCPQFFPAPGFWSPQHATDLTNPDSSSKVGKGCLDTTLFLGVGIPVPFRFIRGLRARNLNPIWVFINFGLVWVRFGSELQIFDIWFGGWISI